MIEPLGDTIVKVQVVGDQKVTSHDITTEYLRDLIEERTQRMADEGYRLWAMGSRGGSMYMVFAKKKPKDGGQTDQAQDCRGMS